MVDFNYFDLIVAAIILILSIKGFIHGFVREFFGLIGLVAGVYLASRLSSTAATFIDANFLHLENVALLKLLGFLAILVMIWLGATILGAIFSKLSGTAPGALSRLLGFFAAAAKYFTVLALIVTALSHVQLAKDKLQHYVQGSILYPYLLNVGSKLIDIESSQAQVSQEPKRDSAALTSESNNTQQNRNDTNTSTTATDQGAQ